MFTLYEKGQERKGTGRLVTVSLICFYLFITNTYYKKNIKALIKWIHSEQDCFVSDSSFMTSLI